MNGNFIFFGTFFFCLPPSTYQWFPPRPANSAGAPTELCASIAHSGVTNLYIHIYALIPCIHFPLTGFPYCGSGNVPNLPWLLIIHICIRTRDAEAKSSRGPLYLISRRRCGDFPLFYQFCIVFSKSKNRHGAWECAKSL